MPTAEIAIRDETEADVAAIAAVTAAAFASLPISQHTEQYIIEALRRAKALTLSLVNDLASAPAPAGGAA